MDLQNLLPKNQKKLYGYHKEFNELVKLYKNKKLPSKIFFNGPKGIGKYTIAYHSINYIFSNKEEYKYDLNNLEINYLNKSHKLILNNTHPNFHHVDIMEDKKIIEISQIRQMINYSTKSTFNNNERIILIDNVENLNLNSVNALLKIVEEPNENTLFILIFDSNKNTLSIKGNLISIPFNYCFKYIHFFLLITYFLTKNPLKRQYFFTLNPNIN